ncbi:RtcB family protein, partial [Candidatus Woesearchaeota archaeon]|nr:RtcB family protein [Candidatus Woesearchaeota archaeon]
MEEIKKPELKQVEECVWEISTDYKKGMLVPARIYGTKKIVDAMDDGVFNQVTNVACLPGIQKYAFCMPDGHWGYGFPIGGVAAFDAETGVISPGGIGFDINCGMRLITTNLSYKEVQPKIKELVDTMFKLVPVGVGARGFVDVGPQEFKELMEQGSKWCVDKGYAWSEDIERTEGNGRIDWADALKVTDKALKRGINQLGTLGSGNHYLEVQVAHAKSIFDTELAKTFGIHSPEQVVIMIHCGSRGFGHQIATDYLRIFEDAMRRYNIHVNDRELSCAPFQSKEGQDYYKAMACAANMAFANRQVILNQVRKGFSKVFHAEPEKLEMHLIYDVAHNIAKLEEHTIDGKRKKVVVHRKGSTRAFPP